MNRLFKDVDLQKQFDTKGFVVIPFLTVQEIKIVGAKYFSLEAQHKIVAPVHSTSDTNNKDLIAEVDNFLKAITKEALFKYLEPSKVFLSNYLVKEVGCDSVINPHSDWSFVDENIFSSASVWCPLTDVDENNGCLYVLEGSHKFLSTLRASPDTPFVFDSVKHLIPSRMKKITMKAGEAVVYNHALIHSSPANLSNQKRIAFVLGIIPEKADLYFYYYENRLGVRKINQYRVDTEWYYSYKKHSVPTNAKLERQIQFDFKNVTEEQFKCYLGEKSKTKLQFIPSQLLDLKHKLTKLLT